MSGNRKNKKKKKPQQYALTKEQHKQKYLEGLIQLSELLGFGEYFSNLATQEKDVFYGVRSEPPKIEIENKDYKKTGSRVFFETALKKALNEIKISLPEREVEIPLYQLFGKGLFIYSRISEKLKETGTDIHNLKSRFDILETVILEADNRLNNVIVIMGLCETAIDWQYVWITRKITTKINKKNECLQYHLLTVHSEKAQSKSISIDGRNRTVYRMGAPDINKNKMHWFKILPDKLGLKQTLMQMPVDIYIQNHAIDRLIERLDPITSPLILIYLYFTLFKMETLNVGNGRCMVPFVICNTKLGYLVIEYCEGLAVIRTFLFVTNNGTPEGQRLEELTHLEKLDKDYLMIDKLSTFMQDDVRKNDYIRELLRKIGCENLLELEYETCKITPENCNAKLIESYLQKKEELFMEEAAILND